MGTRWGEGSVPVFATSGWSKTGLVGIGVVGIGVVEDLSRKSYSFSRRRYPKFVGCLDHLLGGRVEVVVPRCWYR